MKCLKNDFSKNTKKLILSLVGFSIFALSASSFAANTPSPDLSQQVAKVDVKLGLLSNKKADIIIRIPAEQAYGFVGPATTPEQNATVDNVVDTIKQNMGNIITVDSALRCKYKINEIEKFDIVKEGYEENTDAVKKKVSTEYNVLKIKLSLSCLSDLPERKINISLGQHFKNINKILVNLKAKQQRRFIIDSSSGSFTF